MLGNAYTVRKDIGIESGIKYFWFAESVNANTNDAAESVWFYVLNNEDKYEFQSAMEGTRDAVELMQDSIIQRLLMASVYVRYQLYKDALDITTSVLNEQPHNIMALKIQARIYEIIQQPIETKRLLEITQRYMENQ